jgi:hypothetical protein
MENFAAVAPKAWGITTVGQSKKQRHNKGIFFKGILFILFKGIGEGLDGIPRKAQSMVK